jgi:hypothetical protein
MTAAQRKRLHRERIRCGKRVVPVLARAAGSLIPKIGPKDSCGDHAVH